MDGRWQREWDKMKQAVFGWRQSEILKVSPWGEETEEESWWEEGNEAPTVPKWGIWIPIGREQTQRGRRNERRCW